MCLSVYKHSCCEYLIINQVVSSGNISNKWGHLLQPVAFGSRALKPGNELFLPVSLQAFVSVCQNKHYEYSQVATILDLAVHSFIKNKAWAFARTNDR